MAVLGNEAVGKTQLISTVTSPTSTNVANLPEPPAEGTDEYYAQRTPGVQLTDIVLQDDRVVRALDLGGQQQFIASHRPIIVTGFGIYLLVLNLLAGLEGMLQSGRYWIRFVIATRHPAMFQDCLPPPLLVLFSHSDHADQVEGKNPQRLSRKVYAQLRDEFCKYFNWMLDSPCTCDCRVRSHELRKLLIALDEAHKKVAKVCHVNHYD